MMCPPKTILVANIRLIGDVILTTPLISLLKEAYPEAAIDILVNRGTGEFLEKDQRVRTVIYADNSGVDAQRKNGGYLRRIFRRYDLAINMNASDRGNIAVLLAGRITRVGFCNNSSSWRSIWQRRLLTHPLTFPENIPVVHHCGVVAKALQIPYRHLTVDVFWDNADEVRVNGILKERGVHTPFFVIHPFARWIYKYWRPEGFAAVSDAIVERYHLHPVWTSSPSAEEKAGLAGAAALCRHKPSLIAGDLSLNQMACLLKRADCYLGLDTAISHLAASVGTPMVALYGPTFISRWFPWYNPGASDQLCPPQRGRLQRGNIVVVQKDWKCVPCGKAGCDDSGQAVSPCMQEITEDEVLAAVAICLSDTTVDAPGLKAR